jgi:hypothetical protein
MLRSLLLHVSEGAFGFAGARFLKAGDQGLIKHSLRFGLLSGLELRHSHVKQRISAERFLSDTFL